MKLTRIEPPNAEPYWVAAQNEGVNVAREQGATATVYTFNTRWPLTKADIIGLLNGDSKPIEQKVIYKPETKTQLIVKTETESEDYEW